MTPRISVILPVYNAQDYLVAAMDSVLAQSFTDFELLAHDDGSSDGSLRILQDYARKDPRVVVTTGPNQGIVGTMNALIHNAQGDLLARMDADDICLPDRFAKQIAFLDANPDHVMVASATLMIDGDGRRIGTNVAPLEHAEIDAKNVRGITTIEHPAVMMRKDAVMSIRCYDPQFLLAEDLDLWLRLAEIGKIANLPDVLLQYRVHDNSLSASRQDEQEAVCRAACEAAWARRGVQSSFDFEPWRMQDTRVSRRAYYAKYGWRAWHAGYSETWRYYAFKTLRTDPLWPEGWKLLILGALRKPVSIRG